MSRLLAFAFMFRHGSAMIPHPKKTKVGGEDALFTKKHSLAVYDGVSAWMIEDGIDAGIFAFDLSINTKKSIKKYDNITETVQEALKETQVNGSATVSIVKLDSETGVLETFTTGDSGFLLLRRMTRQKSFWNLFNYFHLQEEQEKDLYIASKSIPMMHDEDCPFQLPLDNPKDAQLDKIQLQKDDILVLGTDGLFDNLSDEEIVDHINENPLALPKHLAWLLAHKAKQKYEKIDDISVIVAKIV